jgi:Ca2+-binding RTX toxin-like protein
MASELTLEGPGSAGEGTSSSPTVFTFTVTRAGDTSTAVSVDYAVSGTGSTPAYFGDFAAGVLPTGTVDFAPDELTKTISINVVGDTAVEGDETFKVTLSGATNGATITDSVETATILNDDADAGILGVTIHQGSSYGNGVPGSVNRFGSTDPTDIAYNPVTGGYYLVDSEVDEAPFRATNNMFRLDAQGNLITGVSLTNWTKEPTGVAVWVTATGAQHLFITDDNKQRVYEIDAAKPGVVLHSFSTTTFGCADPEDISINPNNGNLFILSENDHRIYEVTQAGALVSTIQLPNTFVPIPDPNASDSGAEGLAYDAEKDVFYIVGGFSTDIFVVNRSGQIVDTIDILAQYPNANGLRVYGKGLELGPSSDGSGNLSLWVTDYGLDQKADGRLIEIMLDRPAPPPPPPPDPGETLTGTSGNDVLNATSDSNWTVDGLAGSDTITTLGGNDIITGGAGNDSIASGGGDDVIQFNGSSQGFDSIDGGGGNDRIEATAKGTVIGLASLSGVEAISANGFGSVSIKGSSAGDVLDFTTVTLTGITAINGGGGNDTISGSAAADVIAGGAGADILRGNGGADRFDFNAVTDSRASARDQVVDFQQGTDKFDLVGVDAVGGVTGNQAFSFIGEAGFSNHAGELRIDHSDPAKTLILGDVNGDGIADFAIHVAGNIPLNAGDFLL